MEHVAILAGALAIDLVAGEYPGRFHPVVWMGKVIDFLLDRSPRSDATRQFIFGVALVAVVLVLFTVPAWALLNFVEYRSEYAFIFVGAFLLKSTFSIRALWASVDGVRDALEQANLQDARHLVGQIVSRDTVVLDESQVAAAAIESAAENFTDSVVAPLFYFMLLGPMGALGYRVVNTLDAMVGYHGHYEYLGKAAARLDDLLNLIPARLGALLIVLCSAGSGTVGQAWRTTWRDSAATESPNGGWTMSAMAGALGVRLEKVGAYQLGAEYNMPEAADISRCLSIVATAVAAAVLLATLSLIIFNG